MDKEMEVVWSTLLRRLSVKAQEIALFLEKIKDLRVDDRR